MLSQIDYSVIGPIFDSPRLRCLTFSHATATRTSEEEYSISIQVSIYREQCGLTVAGTRPNSRKMDVSRGNSLSREKDHRGLR